MDDFDNEEKVVEKREMTLWHLGSLGTLGYCGRTDDHDLSDCNIDLDPDNNWIEDD